MSELECPYCKRVLSDASKTQGYCADCFETLPRYSYAGYKALEAENKRLKQELSDSGKVGHAVVVANKALEAENKRLKDFCAGVSVPDKPGGLAKLKKALEELVRKGGGCIRAADRHHALESFYVEPALKALALACDALAQFEDVCGLEKGVNDVKGS